MTDSALVAFQLGRAPDHRGRTIDQIRARDAAWLEATHDYIQWLFPLPEPSPFNPEAPLLTPADIARFQAEADLRDSLHASLMRMRLFYFGRPERPWLTPGNHNFRRLTRILRCLALTGLTDEAATLLADLERLDGRIVGETTRHYWREAAVG